MNGKVKIGLIALILGVVTVALLASPIQAYMNEEADLVRTRDQERDRLRTYAHDCDGGALQAQTRDQFRMQAHGCDCGETPKQKQFGPEDPAGSANRVRNGTRDQFRYQHCEELDA